MTPERLFPLARWKTSTGYEIRAVDGQPLGSVDRIEKPSRIRRGRMQSSPWWRPLDRAGRQIAGDCQKLTTAIDAVVAARNLG